LLLLLLLLLLQTVVTGAVSTVADGAVSLGKVGGGNANNMLRFLGKHIATSAMGLCKQHSHCFLMSAA
jgi:hypothetical protein